MLRPFEHAFHMLAAVEQDSEMTAQAREDQPVTQRR
jgi:hypothetical protein